MAEPIGDITLATTRQSPRLSGAERRTLQEMFRHPVAHNLRWSDVIALFEMLGGVEHKANGEVVMRLGHEHHLMHRPHVKDLNTTEVLDLRKFLASVGISGSSAEVPALAPAPAAPDLLVVVDHRDARIYHIDIADHDVQAHVIRPYDPHHILHHLSHKDHSHEQGQRAPEDATFYERITQAVAGGDRIVLIGHGTGKSNAADHLAEYLRTHHHDIYQRIARDVVADLSCATPPQLLAIAQSALR
jgi:hypothetical protein